MCRQTGGVISTGYGTLHFQSSKKKLNENFSTEAKLIGTSDYVPFNLWMVMFMESQGYKIKKNILFRYHQRKISM